MTAKKLEKYNLFTLIGPTIQECPKTAKNRVPAIIGDN
jgi:hypothetical protein